MIHLFKTHDLRSKLKFDIKLEKNKSIYCFIGKNGAGKTRLLENLAKAFIQTHKRFRVLLDSEEGYFKPYYMNNFFLNKFDFDTVEGMKLNESVIRCKKISEGSFRDLFALAIEGPDFCPKMPICFISAENRGYTLNLSSNPELLSDNEKLFELSVFESLRMMHFHPDINYTNYKNKSLADWIATRTIINPETVSFDSRRALAEVDLLFNILSPLMPKDMEFFDKIGVKKVRYEPKTLYVADIPIDKMPTGVVSLMHIMQEIISCYSVWNGVSDDKDKIDDIQQMEGIVFIDEIEAHMHPEWQAAIIPFLRKSFPKTTFYIATHSAAIIATTEKDEAYMLSRDGEDVTAQALGNPRDWYWEVIFSAGFDVRLPLGEQESIEDKILAFSELAQEFMREKDEDNRVKLKCEFAEKYQELKAQFKIMPSGADKDPRRKAVEQIWENAQ